MTSAWFIWTSPGHAKTTDGKYEIVPANPPRYYLLKHGSNVVAVSATMTALAMMATCHQRGYGVLSDRWACLRGDCLLLRHRGRRVSFTREQADFVASTRNGTAIPVC